MDSEKKVLILDEDSSARQRLALRLVSLRLKPLEAANLDQAKNLILQQKPDFVVTEWAVGSVEGALLFQQLKIPTEKICVFTGLPVEGLAETARRAGVTRLFHKNDRYKLLECLEKVSEGAPAPVLENTEGIQILVIDDSPTIRMTLRKALAVEFKGSVIREADDGRTAISEMSHKRVHLIVTDLEMPGMDGREFLERMKSNPLLQKKPIIVFSGNITPELRQAYEAAKNIRFLVKPCDPIRLVEAAREMLSAVPSTS